MSDNFMRIRKGLIINPTTSIPTSSVDGAILFDDNEKKFKRWDSNANAWVPLGEGAGELNFVVLPTEPSADNADYVLIYDVSANAYKKQTRANFLSDISRIRTVDTFSSNGSLTSSHDHVRIDCSSGAVTLNLPPAALNIGLQYTIKKIDSTSNPVIINGGADLIDGSSTLSFNIPNQSFTIVAADSGAWDIV